MSDNESLLDEDEEEALVYVEFEGLSGGDTFCNENLQLDMVGLDTDHPLIRVNDKYYEGTYEDAVGTYMFFENDDNPKFEDPIFDIVPTLKFFKKTNKVLKMKRVFVKPKLQVLDDSNSIPNLEALREAGIPLNYQENALKLWETMKENRREAFNKYLEKQRQKKEKRQQGIELNSESDDEVDDDPFVMYNSDSKAVDSTMQSSEVPDDDNLNNTDNNFHQLTIIDPGPSTSKDSIPWVSPTKNIITTTSTLTDTNTATTTTVTIASTFTATASTSTDILEENESREFNHKPIEIKNQGYIKVLQRRKPIKYIRHTKKSKKKEKVSKTCDQLSTMNIDEANSESTEIISDKHDEENELVQK